MTTLEIMKNAKAASKAIAAADENMKNKALMCMADELEKSIGAILEANDGDIERAKGTMSDVKLDRLKLTEARIKSMAEGIRDVVKLPDPVGEVLDSVKRESGLDIKKVAVPLGVVAIIYESRPNVTSDAAALAVKSGNACILRSGKEAHKSASAITDAMRRGLVQAGLPEDTVMLVEDTTRASATELMTGKGYIDLLIPRGGAGLIASCVENATVPCIETGTGICHVFIDKTADFTKALNILDNAKTSRPSVCNAAEVCLVHKDIAEEIVPLIVKRLACESKTPVELRMDPVCLKAYEAAGACEKAKGLVKAAGEADFDTEFLDYIMAVKAVDSVEEAVSHIAAHSTHHSEAIVTEDERSAEIFTQSVDSAAVYVNASTRFTDGGEFGLGCEMGISTQKIHARGPMGLKELTTYKYIVRGNGTIR